MLFFVRFVARLITAKRPRKQGDTNAIRWTWKRGSGVGTPAADLVPAVVREALVSFTVAGEPIFTAFPARRDRCARVCDPRSGAGAARRSVDRRSG